MHSIRTLYRVGFGPSSSHAMGPDRAARLYLQRHREGEAFRVTLLGSLAATGKGHLTDKILERAFQNKTLEILWKPEVQSPRHPNGMIFETVSNENDSTQPWEVFSVGGGELAQWDESEKRLVRIPFEFEKENGADVYPDENVSAILLRLESTGKGFWDYILEHEGTAIYGELSTIWQEMKHTIVQGLNSEGVLPGGLQIARKAADYFAKMKMSSPSLRTNIALFAYALASSEENASGNRVVTAPTCGSCGVMPAVLRTMKETFELSDEQIVPALGIAGLFGVVVKTNGSISGAEVGCQGEIGVACAMAAAAAAKLMGGTPRQIEYAAEIGLEHHLGLTCDPVLGLVQIPCIERNALAATKAVASAQYAILSDGTHKVKFDDIIETMLQTGRDLSLNYRETSLGGLASILKR